MPKELKRYRYRITVEIETTKRYDDLLDVEDQFAEVVDSHNKQKKDPWPELYDSYDYHAEDLGEV